MFNVQEQSIFFFHVSLTGTNITTTTIEQVKAGRS